MFGLKYIAGVATLEYDSNLCNGCKMCLFVCPHEVFGYENKRAVVLNKDLCMECGACALNCESGALAVRSGVGCASGIINGILNNSDPSCDCSNDDSNNCCC